MPTRLLRAELLESEAWLSVKDNVDRLAWIACFLTVDTLGDMPAGPQRLMRLWRPYGVDSPEKVSKVLRELADVDLVRVYEVGGKPYLYVPRFKQATRFLGHIWPISPWASTEEKQRLEKKSPVNHKSPPVILRDPPLDVDVDKRKGSSSTRGSNAVVSSDSIISGRSPKGARLTNGWEPSDKTLNWIRAYHPNCDLQGILAEFRDYWIAVPGTRGCKLDWDATFRNRIRAKFAKVKA